MAGFIRGIVWGGVVALGGLVAMSQLVPTANAPKEVASDEVVPDQPTQTVPSLVEAPAPLAEDEAKSSVGAEAASAEPKAEQPSVVNAPNVMLEGPAVEPLAPEGQVNASIEPAPTAPAATAGEAPSVVDSPVLADPAAADQVAAQPATPQEAPNPPPSVAPADAMADILPESEPDAGLPATVAAAPEAVTFPAPSVPETDPEPQTAELPPPPPLTAEEEALLQPVPAAPVSDESVQVAAPVEPAPPPASVLPPTPGLTDTAEGVITGRLPKIGEAEVKTDKASAPAPETEEGYDPAQDASLPPLQRYARAFENTDQKPIFAILLEDKGEEVNRAELAAMNIALTVVIDPLSPGAADRAAIWRAGGQEVVLSAESLPEGATAGDLEQIFQALASRMPESVAVIDASASTFQNNRPLASQIVPILADQGRGLVTFDQGLNAADQVARREDLPSATIFRRFDPDNATGPAVKRYLDRAVFKAAQEGQVAVIGSLRPETIAGLLEWTVEGRASTVAIAPISALLARR